MNSDRLQVTFLSLFLALGAGAQRASAGEAMTSSLGEFDGEIDVGGSNGWSSYRVVARFDESENLGLIAILSSHENKGARLACCCVIENVEMNIAEIELPYRASIDSKRLVFSGSVNAQRWNIPIVYTAELSDRGWRVASESPLLVAGKKMDLGRGRVVHVVVEKHSVHISQKHFRMDKERIIEPKDVIDEVFGSD